MLFQQGVFGNRSLTWAKPGVLEAPSPCTVLQAGAGEGWQERRGEEKGDRQGCTKLMAERLATAEGQGDCHHLQPALILLLAFHPNESLQYFKRAFDPLERITATINSSTS